MFSAVALVIAVGAKSIIVFLYGEGYASRFFLVYPLLIWLILGINNNFWGIRTLLASGHSKEYSKCFQVSVAIMIAANIIFIYLWGDFGAAIAPAVSEFALSVLLYIEMGKIKTCVI